MITDAKPSDARALARHSFLWVVFMAAQTVAQLGLSAVPGTSAVAQPSDPEVAGRTLRIVEVDSRGLNCLFDKDCTITANDRVDSFDLPGVAGTGRLQSRIAAVGEAGTTAAGLYHYKYRIDLGNMAGLDDIQCVDRMTLDFPGIVPVMYRRETQTTGEAFVVTRGGIGRVKPYRATTDGKSVTFYFQGLCTGGGPNQVQGLSSYFFGVTAKTPAKEVRATLRDSRTRRVVSLTTRGAGGAVFNPGVIAAQPGVSVTETLSDPARERLEGATVIQRGVVGPTVLVTPGFEEETVKPDRVINFENVTGPAGGPTEFAAGVALTKQYWRSHGIAFGDGASIQRCQDTATNTVCVYPTAASLRHAGFYDGVSNDGRLVMTFSVPVEHLQFKVNPTGGKKGEVFRVEMEGFDEAGALAAVGTTEFKWDDDTAFAWPNLASITAREGRSLRQITARMIAVDRSGRPVRFMFDDLGLVYAEGADPENPEGDEPEAPPVGAAILAGEGPDRDLGPAQEIAWPNLEKGTGQTRKPLFKPAPRYRAPIDWPGAEAHFLRQRDMGFAPASIRNRADLDRAALPVLLPGAARAGIDLAVTRDGNSYSAAFDADDRAYEYYGTRILTRINNRKSAPARPRLRFVRSETSFSAIFSAYGASYRLIRYCRQDSPKLDPGCYDEETMRSRIARLMIALGAKAGERP